MLVLEEAEKRIQEVGGFSTKLEEVLLYLLKESQDIRDTVVKENEARKAETEKRCKEMEKQFQVTIGLRIFEKNIMYYFRMTQTD